MYTRIKSERGISKVNLLQKEFDLENIFYAKIKKIKILRNLRIKSDIEFYSSKLRIMIT